MSDQPILTQQDLDDNTYQTIQTIVKKAYLERINFIQAKCCQNCKNYKNHECKLHEIFVEIDNICNEYVKVV
jgi:hypothetical protein